MKLIQQGRIPKDESIVVSITGNGLKTLETVQNDLVPPEVIEAKLSEFDRLLEREKNATPTERRPMRINMRRFEGREATRADR